MAFGVNNLIVYDRNDRCLRYPENCGWRNVFRDTPWVRACEHAVRTLLRRGEVRAPTRRLVAEGYREREAGTGVLLSAQAA